MNGGKEKLFSRMKNKWFCKFGRDLKSLNGISKVIWYVHQLSDAEHSDLICSLGSRERHTCIDSCNTNEVIFVPIMYALTSDLKVQIWIMYGSSFNKKLLLIRKFPCIWINLAWKNPGALIQKKNVFLLTCLFIMVPR